MGYRSLSSEVVFVTDNRDFILIVEDDRGMAELISESIMEAGFDACISYSGAEALDILEHRNPYMMILDYKLNDMTAEEIIKTLRNRDFIIPPFIISTGNGDERVAVEMMKSGARDYLIKDGKFLDIIGGLIKRIAGEIEKENALLRAREENARLEEKLLQAQKMESIGRLAGGVAHDFNNMLSVILCHAEMGMDRLGFSHPVYENMMEIHKAAIHSASLTRQLLTFARRQTIAPRELNLNESISRMISMLKRLIGENIRLEWKPGDSLWPVKVDPTQLDQILNNLCINSRDAIKDVGTITVETANETVDEKFCGGDPDSFCGDFVCLRVSDNGCGMDKEQLSQIFEPFFTTKKTGEGTGLGLPMVYGAVRQNGGFVKVYSEPGQGTVFEIYLPGHDVSSQKKSTIDKEEVKSGEKTFSAITEDSKSSKQTVLLVEDEDAVLSVNAMVLRSLGYKVLAAGGPLEALNMLAAYTGEVALMMSDVVMPDMNGKELGAKIREIYPCIKQLFISGYTAEIISKRGILDDGVNFIQKPFSMTELKRKLSEILDS
jgi:signal transduction histidine kinase